MLLNGISTPKQIVNLTGLVPYTGATSDVNLGTHTLTAKSVIETTPTLLKLNQTTPQHITGTPNFDDIRLILPGTINRDSDNLITSVVKTGGRTITPTRGIDGFIQSITDGIKTWTFTRTGGFITSWSVV